MPRISFHLQIEAPALDRLITYLEGGQQQQIDAMKEQVRAATDHLQRQRTTLDQTVKENK